MKLKDSALALICTSILLLALGIFTGGIIFYLSFAVLMAGITIDYLRYRSILRDLVLNLTVTKQVYGKDLSVGSRLVVDYILNYTGKRSIALHCVQLPVPSMTIQAPEIDIALKNGTRKARFIIRPTKQGKHLVHGLQMTVESLLFRGLLNGGGDYPVNIYVALSRIRSMSFTDVEEIRYRSGSDFSTVRGYQPGDSVKNVDWARSSKSDTLIVREFEDAHALPLFILLDVDTSMQTGDQRTELETAVQLSMLISQRVLMDNERTGLACFSSRELVEFMPLGSGKAHRNMMMNRLMTIQTADIASVRHPVMPSLREVVSTRKSFSDSQDLSALFSVMGDAIDSFSANIREDGFIKAVNRASSAGTKCHLVIVTNLSMGITSLLYGIRLIQYHGHNVTVMLTPHIWYESREDADPGTYFEQYLWVKEIVSLLRSMKINVLEMSPSDKPEKVILSPRVRGSNIRR